MSFTALLVELLIIGFGGLLWISLAVVLFWGTSWLQLSELQGWSATITLLVVAASYIVGLLLDSLCATIFDPYEKLLRNRECKQTEIREHSAIMRLYVMILNPQLSQYFEGRYNRSRLLRATALNSSLAFAFGFLLVVEKEGFSWGVLVLMLASAAVLVGIMLRTWKRYVCRYYQHLEQVWILEGNPPLTSALPKP